MNRIERPDREAYWNGADGEQVLRHAGDARVFVMYVMTRPVLLYMCGGATGLVGRHDRSEPDHTQLRHGRDCKSQSKQWVAVAG
jgi:hypothetical protein